ncbi:MAG: glycosyl hydrolase family 18 protein [Candidatus Sungbacteria bacterium]|nr:glycosyl hydrolase family 18 protein [Candidatus Sungbacteria bacterium]
MRRIKFVYFSISVALFFSALIPGMAYAKIVTPTPAPKPPAFEISGWIPYWRTATGTTDALIHLDTFTEINPFGYTVARNGDLFDAMNVDSVYWQILFKAARAKKIRVIPTVMWSNTEAIDKVMKSKKLRTAHIKQIVAAVKANGFDGIDIDYEGKKAETKPYFSAFLRELYAAMGKKWVMCTIESRTPLDSRFDVIPKNIEFANDYVAINKYCDRVRIMAYDQQSIDQRLNDLAPGPYIPVADPKWVEKVITLAAKTISKKKIVIGIPTYGYEYEVKPLLFGYRYDRLWAFNPRYALDLAVTTGINPERNMAGELSFSYLAASAVSAASALVSQHDTTRSNNPEIATTSNSSQPAAPASGSASFRIVWWSDARAIKDKVDLAKKLGVRGVAIFKIDGGEDPGMWDVLAGLKK